MGNATHTTNDAPVTVEQCDIDMAERYGEWLDGLSDRQALAFTDGKLDELPRLFARHRLAALASAPAGDGVREAVDGWFLSDQDIRGRWQIRHRGKHVEYFTEGDGDDAHRRLSELRWAAVCEALDRPRAAVGEQRREAIARIIDPPAWALCDRLAEQGNPTPARRAGCGDSLEKADAILALQSLPAKE